MCRLPTVIRSVLNHQFANTLTSLTTPLAAASALISLCALKHRLSTPRHASAPVLTSQHVNHRRLSTKTHAAVSVLIIDLCALKHSISMTRHVSANV